MSWLSVERWSTAASMLAGLVYLAAVFSPRPALQRRWIAGLVLLAVAARGVVAAAPPLLETDFYRYLWDGAVVSAGLNPYAHAPLDVLSQTSLGVDTQELNTLAQGAGGVLASVNHPYLKTIYPPLAQVAFAAAAWIDPFGAQGWRVVLLICDVITVVLLTRVLAHLKLPVDRIGIYGLNPLLLRESYGALHMDLVVLPFVVGALLLALRGRGRLASLVAIAGSAVKVWPALLVPLIAGPLWGRWKQLAALLVGTALLGVLLWSPALIAWGDPRSGFIAYGQFWQNNDGFFRAGVWLCERVLEFYGAPPWYSHRIMRAISTAAVFAVAWWATASGRRAEQRLPLSFLVVTAAAFLLSPTQLPWYWIWSLPLLVVVISRPLLLYTALLPLYYVQDDVPGVHWVEHAPVWVWLIASGIHAFRDRRGSFQNTVGVSRAS